MNDKNIKYLPPPSPIFDIITKPFDFVDRVHKHVKMVQLYNQEYRYVLEYRYGKDVSSPDEHDLKIYSKRGVMSDRFYKADGSYSYWPVESEYDKVMRFHSFIDPIN